MTAATFDNGRQRAPRTHPPYARQQRDALADPAVSVWVAIGPMAWNAARSHQGDYAHGRPNVWLLVPDDTEPDALDWTCCRGHEPVLIWRAGKVAGERIKALIVALMLDGVERVLIAGLKEGHLHIAEVAHG